MLIAENLYLIPVGVLCFALLFLFYVVTQYVRHKIAHSNAYINSTLILTEYLLFGYIIFSAIYLPYQLNTNSLVGKLSISRVMFNENSYYILFITFILISFTSFNSTKVSLKENAKYFLFFTVISSLAVLILYQFNHYIFSIEKINSDGLLYYADTKQKQLNEIFIAVLPTLIWLYFVSKFKTTRTSLLKSWLFDYLPIIIWFLIFCFMVINPFLLSKEAINSLLNTLGAFG